MENITSRLGKLLFPRLPRDVRRRKMDVVYITLLVGLVVASIVAFTMLMRSGTGR
jgi:hypothetical protein